MTEEHVLVWAGENVYLSLLLAQLMPFNA